MSETDRSRTPRLVYVDGAWAYFTTRPDWQKQWGDDWNDAPYEHNAGTPYAWAEYMGARGVPPYEIVTVAWSADLETPDYGHLNSPYSVEQINAGAVAWLRSPTWKRAPVVTIPAGTVLQDFIGRVNRAGGTVYMAVERQSVADGNQP